MNIKEKNYKIFINVFFKYYQFFVYEQKNISLKI